LFNPQDFSLVPVNDDPAEPPKVDLEKMAEKKIPVDKPKRFMDLAPGW
jgi:hypothetical protein